MALCGCGVQGSVVCMLRASSMLLTPRESVFVPQPVVCVWCVRCHHPTRALSQQKAATAQASCTYVCIVCVNVRWQGRAGRAVCLQLGLTGQPLTGPGCPSGQRVDQVHPPRHGQKPGRGRDQVRVCPVSNKRTGGQDGWCVE
jgi:hypothetical protein